MCYPGPMTVQAIKDAYERVIEPVDPAAVIVTCASGGDRAGCLVTFNAPCSVEPARYAVWLAHRNHTYRVALGAGELTVHMLTDADLLRQSDVRHIQPGQHGGE